MEALRPIVADKRAADILVELLDDGHLEIRILAAEYLGIMRSRGAAPALQARIAPEHDPRLRLAALDALAELGEPSAQPAFLAVLASGPGFLHASAANGLIYLATAAPEGGARSSRAAPDAAPRSASGAAVDVAAVRALAGDERSAGRAQAVRALGGVLRGRGDDAARELLLRLSRERDVGVALAAIEALGAMGDREAAPGLRGLLRADLHRRRAAASALGDLGDTSARDALHEALGAGDDRLSGAAALALSKLPATASTIAALERASQRRGWAAVINASAALARLAPADRAETLLTLAYHRDRLVRVNAALGLGRLRAPQALEPLGKRLREDESPLVREAAARALSQFADALSEDARAALAQARERDTDAAVRAAAAAALAAPFVPPARDDWRNFAIVEPQHDGQPVRQAAYFVQAADGLVQAYYSDERGYLSEEQTAPGRHLVAPRSHATRY